MKGLVSFMERVLTMPRLRTDIAFQSGILWWMLDILHVPKMRYTTVVPKILPYEVMQDFYHEPY